MNIEERKLRRRREKASRRFSVLIALVIGFVFGVAFTILLSQKYTIVISDPSEIKTVDYKARDISPTITPTPNPKTDAKNSAQNGRTVVIDAGHQKKGNFGKEPIAPGASKTKAKVASGTTGVSTKIPEYIVTLDVSKLLEYELESRGYDVIMVRETHDVDISNSQRAEVANKAKADAFIRIHCNGSESSSAKGALTMCQTAKNPYCGEFYTQSRNLSDCVIDGLCAETGAKNLGVSETDTMSGINWCKVPVTIVEMGFMSNPEEDELLCNKEYQKKLAQGIANGIDNYFK
ncbi:MAG: N-acetylmuramoyl-L-alanine amidase [Ruminococcaceae bacterium]|nr:N-acetylmuramoyl-L-alanine amidase [Oscillospiraceae bacterium]